MVNPLTQNNVEPREDNLEKEKGMDRGGKVILLLAVLFRLTTSKGFKSRYKFPTNLTLDPAKQNLYYP